ncbi:condensation domain-containing protein [Streptomyces sp. NPDC000594]|uniref:condensation domain-containing protein n=1 Tax=Streptomyces sp. NPDC000594 TaxID=3154261 RepID=UPI003325F142
MPAITPGAGRGLELTAAQRPVLSAQCADPGNTTYNVGQYIDLRGPLEVTPLRRAIARVLAEAPALRLRIHGGADGPRQEQLPFDAEGWRLPRLDTSGAADPVAAAVELVRDQLACPPRLDALIAPAGPAPAPGPAGGAPGPGGPAPGGASLTGTVLVRVGPERHLLFQYFHHLAVDGYGVSLLSRRTADLYTALARGEEPPPSPFAPLSVLVDAERAYADSADEAADRAHWTARYADRPSVTGFARGTAPASGRVLRHTVVLDRADTARLEHTARGARATWAEAVTAAVAAQLRLETGAPEAVLRMYAMARTAPGTLRVPGMAVNVLPVRIPVGDGAGFAALLRRTAAEFRAVRAHQRYRGASLLTGRGGILLNLRPFATELDFHGTPGRIVTLASGPVDDLSLSAVRQADGRLRLDLDANAALYQPAEVAGLADRCAALLRLLAARPDRPLTEPVRPAATAPSAPPG